MKTISTEKLQLLRKGNEGFLLIDVLDKAAFELDHIAGARNVPLATVGFPQVVADRNAGSRTRRVVLYGAGTHCDAAGKAAQLLAEDGFTNVVLYEGGLAAWNESSRARLVRAAKALNGSAR